MGPFDVQFGPKYRSDSASSVLSHFGPWSFRSFSWGPKWPRTEVTKDRSDRTPNVTTNLLSFENWHIDITEQHNVQSLDAYVSVLAFEAENEIQFTMKIKTHKQGWLADMWSTRSSLHRVMHFGLQRLLRGIDNVVCQFVCLSVRLCNLEVPWSHQLDYFESRPNYTSLLGATRSTI